MNVVRIKTLTLVLLALGLGLLWLGTLVGSNGWSPVPALWQDETLWPIVRDIRLPRSAAAWLAGGLLGLSGAVAQGLFRNPLADPYLLGSASGASLGVALALWASLGMGAQGLSWVHTLGLSGAAFLGALGAAVLTLVLSAGGQSSLRLLLSGVVVGVVLGALSSLVMVLEPALVPSMQAFMWGSTAHVDAHGCLVLGACLVLGTSLAWLMRRALDSLALGEATAQSLGLPLDSMRVVLLGVLALATGVAVAQTGLIAFVGLAAPHLVRRAVHGRHGALLLLAPLCGGILLQCADLLARGLLPPAELPVGVLTAVLGGAYLLWLMRGASSARRPT